MKKLNIAILVLLAGWLLWGCQKEDQDYKKFLEGKEVVYPGVVNNPHSLPGNLRAELLWNPSPDPSIVKYVIYWNNKADSIQYSSADHNPADTLRVIVPNLNEYSYSFVIYSIDGNGNHSIPLDVNNVKVYGSSYQSGLVNRTFVAANPYSVTPDGVVTLHFNPVDTAGERFSFAYNVTTDITYTNSAGKTAKKQLGPNQTDVAVADLQSGSTVQFRSAYVPQPGAIDTFYVNQAEVFPTINSIGACDKSKFAKVKLPYDMNPYEGDTDIDRLWDGSVGPQSYPNIFHSDGADHLPQTLTFDMGLIYKNIVQIEETGRNCCHNPDDIEVWGIADITNASTTIDPNSADWPAQSVAKGWTLLGEIKRTDDGQQAMKFNLTTTNVPVRYIRLRIKHNTDGETNYTNMSEITMYFNALSN